MEATVLSYHDSLLTKSDLKLLDATQWLNDKLIGFCFEYFERETFKTDSDVICFINPDVTQFMKLAAAEDIGICLEPLDLPTKSVILFAVNDSAVTDHTSGSHWSLLVYRRDLDEIQHFDSLYHSNSAVARELAQKVSRYLGSGGNVVFKEMEAPSQKNTCDCGVYVICNAEHLCKTYLKQTESSILETITPAYVTNYRSQIKELIIHLSQPHQNGK